MRKQPQKVRLGFLIFLTLTVLAFGVVNLLRTYQGSQERATIARTEKQVRTLAEGALQTEHQKLVRFARDEQGRTGRDAAALLAEVRWLQTLSSLPAGRRGREDVAALSEQVQQNLARLQAGSPAVFPRGEPFLRGCYSTVDGTLQPYGIVVPEGYTDSYSYPLVVTISAQTGGQVPFQSTPPYGGAVSVLAAPDPAGEFGNIGVEELVSVLRDVTLTYSIDPKRVYLIGHEHGADVAWHAAVSYPELFAGLVLFDVTNSCPAGAAEEQGASPLLQPDPTLQQMADFIAASRCPDSYVGNLAHTRVVLLQNAGGDRAALRGARAIAENLRTAGASVEYLEFPLAPGRNFPDWTQQYAIASVMSRAGTLRPAQFAYRTASIRNRHAWWVRLDALGSAPARFSTVSGKLQGDVAEVTTDNVSALTLVPDRLPRGISAVSVDGTRFDAPAKPVALNRSGGKWSSGQVAGLLKREGLSGPFSDVLRDHFLIVYGTSGDDDTLKQFVRLAAQNLAGRVRTALGLNAEVKADADVTDQDRERMNLVLFGGPDVNSVSAQVAGGLPVRLQGGKALVGEQAYEGDDLGVLVCYPNPANPDRMVAMVAGATPAAFYQVLNRFSWASAGGYKWFDYAVFDDRTAGPDSCLALGIFDDRWRLPSADAGAAWTATAAARADLVPQHFPALHSAAQSQEADVQLSDVRPTHAEQAYGAVDFNRTRAGRAIRLGGQTFENGLGVSGRSSVTFDLGGRFAVLKATVGVISAPAGAPDVMFDVLGDGQMQAVFGPVNTGRDAAGVAIEADVRGVSSLTLRTRPVTGDDGAGIDCVWAGAEVSR